jgi:hypothetical protein
VFILVQVRMTLRPVDSTAAHVALHQSACNGGYKLLREGTDPRSRWWIVCVDLVRCDSIDPPCRSLPPLL